MLFSTHLILGFSFYNFFTFFFLYIHACPPSPIHIHFAFQSKVLIINSFKYCRYSCVSRTLDMVKVRTTSRPTVINLSKMVGEAFRYWRIGVGFYDCLYSTLSQPRGFDVLYTVQTGQISPSAAGYLLPHPTHFGSVVACY
jgi:hypothetical protein